MDLRTDTISKIEVARKMYEGMNTLQRNVVKEFAIPIFEIQNKISALAEKACAGEVCEKCGGGCCTDGMEYALEIEEFLYAMFRMTNEEVTRVIEAIKSSNEEDSKCSLADEKGCMLPSDARPINCKAFHCKSIPGGGDIMGKHGKKLREAYAHYTEMVDAMGV